MSWVALSATSGPASTGRAAILRHHPALLDGDGAGEHGVAHRRRRGVDGGGELDQLAGGSTGEPKPLPQPDGGGRGALGDGDAAGVQLADQPELDRGQPLRHRVRRVERREQIGVGERPRGGLGAVVDGPSRLRQRPQHEATTEQVYGTFLSP
ncbi:hypothetical protein [Micromonospora cremea]|uniref:hypothetical protein n=1 Tax=Micromonospora cremea TaxID=709881 RepID=UPI00313BAAA8